MERVRTGSPMYTRQKSISSTSEAPVSPMMSPMHHHYRSGSTGVPTFRRTQNYAAKAAAQRLARVMAHQPVEDDDDAPIEISTPLRAGRSPRRAGRSPSPALGHNLVDQTSASHSTYVRPSIVAKPALLIPPIKPSVRSHIATLPSEPPVDFRREKRLSVDLGNLNVRESEHQRSCSALQDEIDILQEENDNILEKLRLAEERCEEAKARIRQLEKQAALKTAAQTSDVKNEGISARRLEAETARDEARDEAASAIERLQEASFEIKSYRTLTQRVTLTQEDMEEVVLKRCWLARYWKLCVLHGIHADMAETKHEYWSSLAPLPLEVVLSAGQKARDESSSEKTDLEEMDKIPLDLNYLAGEGNIESMLLVEKGLRELASLKVEEAVLLAMAQHRRPNIKLDLKPPNEGQNLVEALELTQEESEDVRFKQAWLTYFWRRAKDHGLEEDIAEERLQYWINLSTHPPNSNDLMEVDRGLLELKKLGIETQLWEASHLVIDQDSVNSRTESEV